MPSPAARHSLFADRGPLLPTARAETSDIGVPQQQLQCAGTRSARDRELGSNGPRHDSGCVPAAADDARSRVSRGPYTTVRSIDTTPGVMNPTLASRTASGSRAARRAPRRSAGEWGACRTDSQPGEVHPRRALSTVDKSAHRGGVHQPRASNSCRYTKRSASRSRPSAFRS